MARNKVYLQRRPTWCPEIDCKFKRIALEHMCIGELPEPLEHDGDLNTHRFCLNDHVEPINLTILLINSTDVSWMRWLFDEVFPMGE
ncbi:MAG: hypothetical protein ACYTF1_25140 [Planctomycetota bacterium]|jgi:hypothetical protein